MKLTIIIILALILGCYLVFKKPTKKMNPQSILYSQVDIMETFADNLKLNPEDWIKTTPLNGSIDNPELNGLPSKTASPSEVYKVAARLSALRETVQIPSDGVYCPICHIANTDITKLHTPCPKCGRKLLKFGWD
ncbi:MAG TPA: hypothetical protein PLL75_06530 [Candidatus Omnitrophota bacterium]|nr:hypothetical protein [Candidatus Omnitrophota bacterium]HPS37364.1 hypothetical protein [Candidatus Omnitrophota bacterium]